MKKRFKLFDYQSNSHRLILRVVLFGVSIACLERPPFYKNKLVSKVRELHVLVKVSELVDALLRELRLNGVKAIVQIDVGDVFEHEQPHWLFQGLRHLVAVAVGVEVGLDERLELGLVEHVGRFHST